MQILSRKDDFHYFITRRLNSKVYVPHVLSYREVLVTIRTGGNGEEFANQLDEGHNVTCPWRGNNCAKSLVQFPPTPPSALIRGYKERCYGLHKFLYLPIVAASAIEQMKLSRRLEIDRSLVQSSGF